MRIGMIGLGRMGANMVRRLVQGGHECVVYDAAAAAVRALSGERNTGPPRSQSWCARSSRRAPCGSWCRPRSSTR